MASSFCKPLRDHSSVIRSSTTKHTLKPSLLLKDYLRDDLSSCSSSGFKSFPRRQCCTTVVKDLKLKHKSRRKRNTSALQRVSEAVMKAMKSLPLSLSQKSAAKGKKGVVSRSLSRKLLSGSFWRKAGKEEGCRRSFRELLMQDRDYKPTSSFLDEDNLFITTTSISSGGCGSNSWGGESEFTFSLTVTSSDSSTETNDSLPHSTKDKNKIQGVTNGDWQNEKEQFSPVSVLDCPFKDEEEIKSHFNPTTHSLLEGIEHKHMQKRQHFKSVASQEPVVLEKRIALSELEEDETHNHSTMKQCSQQLPIMHIEEINARDLVNIVKRSNPSNCLMNKSENLIFDYFKQSIEENCDIDNSKKLDLCKVAEDYIQGKPQELYLGWEVQQGRRVYINEMDNKYCGGECKNSDQETQELVMELENDVLTSLVIELVLDLSLRTC